MAALRRVLASFAAQKFFNLISLVLFVGLPFRCAFAQTDAECGAAMHLVMKDVEGKPATWRSTTPLSGWYGCSRANTDYSCAFVSLTIAGSVHLEHLPVNITSLMFRYCAGLNGSVKLTHLPQRMTYLEIQGTGFTGNVDLSSLPSTLQSLKFLSNSFNGVLRTAGLNLHPSLVLFQLSRSTALRGQLSIAYIPRTVQTLMIDRVGLAGTLDLTQLPPSLKKMEMFSTKLRGNADLSNLPVNLTELKIYSNPLGGTINTLGSLVTHSKIGTIKLSSNSLQGTVTLGDFPACLSTLYLDRNALTGSLDLASLPAQMSDFRAGYNKLSSNGLKIEVPQAVNIVYLESNSFAGTLDLTAIGTATAMHTLLLSKNKFTGTIDFSGAAPALQNLYITHNSLTGNFGCAQFPPNAKNVILNNNQFSGSLVLSCLQSTVAKIHLFYNKYSGELDVTSLPSSLVEINFYGNKLSGELDMSAAVNLQTVRLGGNQWSGTLPCSYFPPNVVLFAAESTSLSGTLDLTCLPSTLRNLWIHSNKFSGDIVLSNLPTAMNTLHLCCNKFDGTVDAAGLDSTNLMSLYLHSNQLTGTFDFTHLPSTMRELYVYGNEFSGSADFSQLPDGFIKLYANPNDFSGSLDISQLPASLVHFSAGGSAKSSGPVNCGTDFPTRMTKLQTIQLQNSQYSGTFCFSQLPGSLLSLNINHNRFSGSVDFAILPRGLQYLYISDNLFWGSLRLTALPSTLLHLYIGENKLRMDGSVLALSELPKSVTHFLAETNQMPARLTGWDLNTSSLQYIRLQENRLTGAVDLSMLPATLRELTLRDNQLTGNLDFTSIPASLTSIKLRKNLFTGSVDASEDAIGTRNVEVAENHLSFVDFGHRETKPKLDYAANPLLAVLVQESNRSLVLPIQSLDVPAFQDDCRMWDLGVGDLRGIFTCTFASTGQKAGRIGLTKSRPRCSGLANVTIGDFYGVDLSVTTPFTRTMLPTEAYTMFFNQGPPLPASCTASQTKSFWTSLSNTLTVTSFTAPLPPTGTLTPTITRPPTPSLTDTITPPDTHTRTAQATSTPTSSFSITISQTLFPTNTQTLVASPTFSDSRTVKLTTPPPVYPPCPLVSVQTAPHKLDEDVVREAGFAINISLSPGSKFNLRIDDLSSAVVFEVDDSAGRPPRSGFIGNIAPFMRHLQWAGYDGNRTAELHIPPVRNYATSVDEVIMLKLESASVGVTFKNEHLEYTVVGCTGAIHASAAINIASVPSALLQASIALASTASSTASVTTVMGGGASSALDAQALVVVSQMACSSAADRKVSKSAVIIVSPFWAYGPMVVVLGNIGCAILFLMIHVMVARWRAIVKMVSLMEGCVRMRFPSVSYLFAQFFLSGTAFASLRLFQEPSWSSRVIGIVGLFYIVLLFAGHRFMLKIVQQNKMEFRLYAGLTGWMHTLRFLLTRGAWHPRNIRRRFGSAFSVLRPGLSLSWSLHSPIVMLVVSVIAGLPLGTSTAACKTQYALLVVVYIIAAVQLFLVRPDRFPCRSLAGGVTFSLMAVKNILASLALDSDDHKLTQSQTLATVLLTSTIALRSFHGILLRVWEKLYLPRWYRQQRKAKDAKTLPKELLELLVPADPFVDGSSRGPRKGKRQPNHPTDEIEMNCRKARAESQIKSKVDKAEDRLSAVQRPLLDDGLEVESPQLLVIPQVSQQTDAKQHLASPPSLMPQDQQNDDESHDVETPVEALQHNPLGPHNLLPALPPPPPRARLQAPPPVRRPHASPDYSVWELLIDDE